MADHLLGMRVFAKVAEAGSFASAASLLGVSSQMVGRHVAGIEARLGVRLVNRTTQSQSLTEAGRLYLEGCVATLAQVAELDRSVGAHSGGVRGLVRLTAPVRLGTALSRGLSSLLADHRELSVELHLSDLRIDLITDGFDAGVRIGDLPDSDLVARTLGPYRCVTCASPGYVTSRPPPAHPRDLALHDCLDYRFPSHPALHLWTFRRGAETVRFEPVSRFVVNDGRALVEAALAGAGVVQVGEIKVRDELASGRLVRLLPEWEGPVRPMHLVTPGGRFRSPALRAVSDWLVRTTSPAAGGSDPVPLAPPSAGILAA